MKKFWIGVFLTLLYLPVNSQKTVQSKQQQTSIRWVDSVFYSLTPDERISQLIMIAAYSNRPPSHTAEISYLIQTFNLGGIIFFQGGPAREAFMTNYFQRYAKTPLLIGIDGEWGLSMRLDSTFGFPRQMMLGALSDNQLIYKMGWEIANQMKALGIHINFAPVVDINSNPLNPVISNRSFGENKINVTQKGISYMEGMQDNGLLAVAKHFPGHGDTNADSHFTLPVIEHSLGRLDSIEFYPFRELIKKNVSGVMVAHLNIPALEPKPNTASTLSSRIITDLLRKSMGYDGLIFTDALNMLGVAANNKPGELEVKALQAGNDVLLMPADPGIAIQAIKKAIRDGQLRQSQIDSSCRRVLIAKYKAGLDRYKPVDIASLPAKLNTTEATLIQRNIAASAITLVKNTFNLVPLQRLDTLRIALVLSGTNQPNQFTETVGLYKNCDTYFLPEKLDSFRTDSLLFSLRHYNLIIGSFHNTSSLANRNFGIQPSAIAFFDTLATLRKVILHLPATPYALSMFKKIYNYQAILVSYHDIPVTQDFAAQIIFGGIPAQGKLPVTASVFPINTQFTTEPIRLRYARPEEININPVTLQGVDSIVISAIQQKAMPGCQVLAAKDGVVFYNKSFGYHTYDSLRKVKNSDIYDLASLTKITGTLPAIMKLYEENEIKLKSRLSSYFHNLKKTNKKEITLIDILTHQARLQPFIPFYLKLIEPKNAGEKLLVSTASATNTIRLSASSFGNSNVRYRNGFIVTRPDIEHGVTIADDMYLSNSYVDSIFLTIDNSPLLKEKQYKYSDLGFIYLYKLIELKTKTALNEYDDKNFYQKLGAETMGYLPLNRFDRDRIIPTEYDQFFRKQLIHGYVHDPAAAMLGGVSGHAGVFSNANDLAKLMQMYLNKGSFGGEKFFDKETLEYFTSCPFCEEHNRRGIGFDKPEMGSANGPTCQCVSAKSFGHSGFTGTYTWADPENGLLYIFLSNRVCPDAENNKLVEMNVRTRIHEVFTKALAESKKDK
ncbi:MAG TPA: glycoside hydrolase family 3 N-terminal domain-containing protein [Bacteroidales bacterium]|nr:glycoside hydrolase family 3 N-terminal domain-containing protein [Bacteroidales bacterium]